MKHFAIIALLLIVGQLAAADASGQLYFCSASGFQGSGLSFLDKNTCLAQCGNNEKDCQPPKPIDWMPALQCCGTIIIIGLVVAAVFVREGALDRFVNRTSAKYPRLKGTAIYRDIEYSWFHKGGSYQVAPNKYEYHGHLVSSDKRWRTPLDTGGIRIRFDSLFRGNRYFFLEDIPEEDAKNAKTIEDLRRENAALRKQSRDAALEMLDGVKGYSFRLGKIREDLGATIIQATKGAKGYELGNASSEKAEE